MNAAAERRVSFEGDGLRLEGALREGEGAWCALVLHPHPQYGGDMDSFVVTRLCSALGGRGVTTLRFNFRGAGGSEGHFDGGVGEAEDARSAARFLRERAPGARLLLAGYSFGAMVAASVAADIEPAALALVSPPVGFTDLPPLPGAVPALLITGSDDEIAPAERLRNLEEPGRRLVAVAGVDHSWWTGLDELAETVTAFFESVAGA